MPPYLRILTRYLLCLMLTLVALPMKARSEAIRLTEAIDVAVNRTSRGGMIRGNLDVAEQNYFARRINFYLPEISIKGSLPAYSVDESYRLFGGATRSALYRTRDLGLSSFIEMKQSLLTGGDVTVTANLNARDFKYPNTGPDAAESPFVNQKSKLGDFSFSYKQPILKGSDSKNRLYTARDDYQIARLTAIEEQTSLSKEVVEAFFGVLQWTVRSEINRSKLESAQLSASIDSTKFLDGILSEEEWLVSASNRLDAELNMFDVDNQLMEKKRELAILLDRDATTELDPVEPQVDPPLIEGERTQLLTSTDRTAAVQKSYLAYVKARRDAGYAASGHGLSGDLSASYNTGRGDVDVDGSKEDINTQGWGVSLDFVLPLWDGGASSSAVKAARIAADQKELEHNRTIKTAKAEVTNLVNQIDVGYQRLTILSKQIELAASKLAIAESRFADGQISRIELLGSMVTHLEAKDKYLEELKAYTNNRIELKGKFGEAL